MNQTLMDLLIATVHHLDAASPSELHEARSYCQDYGDSQALKASRRTLYKRVERLISEHLEANQ